MQQPPNWQQPDTQYPPQTNTYYPQFQSPLQPGYPPEQQWQQPVIPPVPPKRGRSPWLIIGIVVGIVALLAIAIAYAASAASPPLSPEQFKAQAQDTTVENLDKDGNNDKGTNVHVTCKILNFVKDDSGNTAGANFQSGDTTSFTVIQISFPSGTNVAQLNAGDTLEVWGTDEGVFSGKNAFGGTVQEVEVTALYMTDTTSGYQTS